MSSSLGDYKPRLCKHGHSLDKRQGGIRSQSDCVICCCYCYYAFKGALCCLRNVNLYNVTKQRGKIKGNYFDRSLSQIIATDK